MKHFGAFEAKTHFSEILGKVMEGEQFIITKHGIQVAMIIPFVEQKINLDPVSNSISAIKKLRKGITLGKNLSIKEMIKEGRR
jgi:prevent-host-death family protein